jgi:tight adherence protein B
MSGESILLLTFIATALVAGVAFSALYDFAFQYPLVVRARLRQLNHEYERQCSASVFHNLNREQLTLIDRWREYIQQSGVTQSLAMLAAGGAGLALLGTVAAGLASHRLWLAPLGALPGIVAPVIYVVLKRRQRKRQLILQLPTAFDAINRAVKAGQTVQAAFQIVASELETPISEEFGSCYEQQKLGMSLEAALRSLAKRTGVMELQILVLGLLLQSKSGGSLVELLENLASMVRQRIKFQQRVRALTGEGRMQALILMLLPIAAFTGLVFLAPDYISTLLDRPWLLVITVLAQVVGGLWIRQCINFEV